MSQKGSQEFIVGAGLKGATVTGLGSQSGRMGETGESDGVSCPRPER